MGANYTNDPVWIMTLMAIAFFGNGFASITWSLVSSLAPMRLIGLTGGVFNFVGGLGGITVPLVIGYLAQGTVSRQRWFTFPPWPWSARCLTSCWWGM